MALISCPECGKEISSTAGQCISCGHKFVYCEACDSIEVADATFCSKCGAQLTSNTQNTSAQPEQPVYEKAAHFDLWERNDQANKVAKKVGFFLPLGLSLFSLVFGIIWLVGLIQRVSEMTSSPIPPSSFSMTWVYIWSPNDFNNFITIAMVCACISATILPLYRLFVLYKFGTYYKGLGLTQKDGLANHISYLALDSKANKPKIFAKHTTLDLNYKANCVASGVSGKTLFLYPIISFAIQIAGLVVMEVLTFTALKNVFNSFHLIEAYASSPSDLLNVYNNELVMFIVGIAVYIVCMIVTGIVNSMWLKANSASMHKVANENGLDIINTPYGKYNEVK